MMTYATFTSGTYTLLCLVFFLSFSSGLTAQEWEELNAPPFYKHHSNGFGYNGKAYVLEGVYNNDGPNGVSNEVWEYTPETDSWVQLADFPGTPRAIAIGDFWDDKYYYGFGTGVVGDLTDLWVFDPADTSFTQLPSCPCVGRAHPALIAHNDKIFMGTGSGPVGDLDDWWVYDMITQEWTQKPNVPGGVRHHPFFFGMDEYVYVGGGHRTNWLRFDPATDEWTTIDNAPQGRVAGTQFNYNNKGYVLGGDTRFHTLLPDIESFMQYDPESNEWAYLPSLPNGSRWAPSSFIIDNYLYFLGGLSEPVPNDQSMWRFNLDYLTCLAPGSLNIVNLEATSAGLFWTTDIDGADTLKWRKLGDPTWNIVLNPQPVFTLTGLDICEDYEAILINSCDDLVTSSPLLSFKTGGCCINPDVSVNEVTVASAELEWTGIAGIDEYELQLRPTGSADWQTLTTEETSLSLNDLSECTEYEYQIKSVCSEPDAPFSESFYFYTSGCGVCTDVTYCPITLLSDEEFGFINKVQINGFVNESGNNAGYADFAVPDSEDIASGESFELILEPSGGGALTWNVWIDFNADGNFDSSEMVLNEEFSEGEISRTIDVPNTATAGLTRMRIVYGTSSPNSPCNDGELDSGEAEDYCVNIINPTNSSTIEDKGWNASLSPNPTRNMVRLIGNFPAYGPYRLRVLNAAGRTVQSIDNFNPQEAVDVASLAAGVYFITLQNEQTIQTMKLVKQQ